MFLLNSMISFKSIEPLKLNIKFENFKLILEASNPKTVEIFKELSSKFTELTESLCEKHETIQPISNDGILVIKPRCRQNEDALQIFSPFDKSFVTVEDFATKILNLDENVNYHIHLTISGGVKVDDKFCFTLRPTMMRETKHKLNMNVETKSKKQKQKQLFARRSLLGEIMFFIFREYCKKNFNKKQYQNMIRSPNKYNIFCKPLGKILNEKLTLSQINCIIEKKFGFIAYIVPKSSALFENPETTCKIIYLTYKLDGVFKAHSRLGAVFRSQKICLDCRKMTRHKMCTKMCSDCSKLIKNHENLDEFSYHHCTHCNRVFYTKFCFNNHFETVCKKSFACFCGKLIIHNNIFHKCRFEKTCTRCNKTVNTLDPHLCQMKPLEKVSYETPYKYFVVFDLESALEKKLNVSYHHVILVCASVFTLNEDNAFVLQNKLIYHGEDALSHFMEQCVMQNYDGKCLFLAFNLSGYDGPLILNSLIEKIGVLPSKVIMRGRTFQTFSFSKNKTEKVFLDFLKFVPSSLRNLIKMFGLKDEYKKGFFPYTFLTLENLNYCGEIPQQDFFETKSLSDLQKEEFQIWYQSKQHEVYDLKKELIEYCEADVLLLAQAIQEFIHLFFSLFKINPFQKNVFTLSGLTFFLYRQFFLKEKHLCYVIPRYRGVPTLQSDIAFQFLDHINKNGLNGERFQIIHGRNSMSGECKIGQFFVDGYDKKTNTIFEIKSCLLHGHTCIIDRNRDDQFPRFPKKKKFNLTRDVLISLNQRNLEAQRRENYFQRLGFRVFSWFLCELPEFNRTHRIPVDLSLTYRGGRVESIVHYLKHQDDQPISYLDVTSLYPFVMANCNFPVGEFEIVHPTFVELHDYVEQISSGTLHGVASCELDAPENLFLPVLPVLFNNKMYFPLCQACLDTKQRTAPVYTFCETHKIHPMQTKNNDILPCKIVTCQHDVKARRLTGSWTIPEIKKALEKGYTIHSIHEMYIFKKSSLDLFKDFIFRLTGIKIASSNFPPSLTSEEQKLRYRKDLEEKYDLPRYIKIEHNPGLRTVTKLLQNSLAGKFGQYLSTKNCFVRTRQKLLDIVLDSNNEILGYSYITPTISHIRYKVLNPRENVNTLQYTYPVCNNLVIASYITSYARLYLYQAFECVDDQFCIAYCDTDSIIFSGSTSDLPLGEDLGQFKSEIPPGFLIQEFLSLGPKNYAFKMRNEANGHIVETKKIRGLKQDAINQHNLTFDRMKEMLYTNQHDFISQHTFTRAKNFQVITKYISKKCGPPSEAKRIKVSENISFPFGFNGSFCK